MWGMKIRRTDDPDISFMEADSVALSCYGIVEWRVDMRNRKFLMNDADHARREQRSPR